jgi:hypothetical protein
MSPTTDLPASEEAPTRRASMREQVRISTDSRYCVWLSVARRNIGSACPSKAVWHVEATRLGTTSRLLVVGETIVGSITAPTT